MEPAYEIPKLSFPANIIGRLPTLSPPFVSADDAARFAHELIGDHRDCEYAGVILKNAEGRYFASRPEKVVGKKFKVTQFISSNASGQLIQPQGYTCQGFYNSRQHHLATEQKPFMGVTNDEVLFLANFFLPEDIQAVLTMASFTSVHYLSGFNGSLLKVETRATAGESQLYDFLAHAQEDHELLAEMIQFLKQVVATLQVNIVQSADIWKGTVGKLAPEFFTTYRRAEVVEDMTVQRPACGPLLDSEPLALEYARLRSEAVTEQHYGFILKSTTRQVFIVSQPVTGEMDFNVARAFPLDSNGQAELPSGFAIFALYAADAEYRNPSLIPTDQPSVYKNFLHIDALDTGILKARELATAGSITALPLYILARDGALLKYVSKSSPVEKSLFAKLPAREGDGIALLRNVLMGIERIGSLVHALAHTGELSVVHGSEVWGKEGQIGSGWQPFDGFMRRTLSPVFTAMDDAVRYAHEQIARRVDFTYGGLVLKRQDNLFVVTEPIAMRTETFDPAVVFPPEQSSFIPYGCVVAGVYHTRRIRPQQLWRKADEEQLSRTLFAPHELRSAILDRRGKVRYFSAQDGALLKYIPSGSDLETRFLERLAPPAAHPEQVCNNSSQIKLRDNSLKPSQFIAQVARAGELHVVVASRLWGERGKVTTEWVPAKAPVARDRLTLQPALSPVFSQAKDAVRYVHGRMGSRGHTQFGVILKSQSAEQFIATEPLRTRKAFLSDVFPRPFGSQAYSLPAGFTCDSVYMATPQNPVERVSDDVFADFIAPADLVNLAVLSSSVRDLTVGRLDYPTMYLSTRNGALLSYKAVNLNAVLDLDSGFGPNEPILTLLNSNKLRTPDYVRKVASNGYLEVLLSNPMWATVGLVTSGWRPFAMDVAMSNRPGATVPALGPVFSHIDDAALHSNRLLRRPHAHHVVGAILYSSAQMLYVPQEPETNGAPANAQDTIFLNALFERSSGRSRPLPALPSGYGPVAVYYAHQPVRPSVVRPGQSNWVDHVFWPVDICFMTKSLPRLEFAVNVAYAAGNDGALLKYVRHGGQAEDDLCQLVLGYDYWENQYLNQEWVDKGLETENQYVAKLLKAGELIVVSPSENWSRVGWVTADWKTTESAKVSLVLPWARSSTTNNKDEL